MAKIMTVGDITFATNQIVAIFEKEQLTERNFKYPKNEPRCVVTFSNGDYIALDISRADAVARIYGTNPFNDVFPR